MGIDMTAKSRTTTRNAGVARKDDPAEFWINLGFWWTNEKTGEETFIQIGGVPLDCPADDAEYAGTSEMGAARFNFLQSMGQKIRAGVALGTETDLNGLPARIRRVGPAVDGAKANAGVAQAVSKIAFG